MGSVDNGLPRSSLKIQVTAKKKGHEDTVWEFSQSHQWNVAECEKGWLVGNITTGGEITWYQDFAWVNGIG